MGLTTKVKKGGTHETYSASSNPLWCDSHDSQCSDNTHFGKCGPSSMGPQSETPTQMGGTEPNMNADWCDGHHSQCMDNYNNLQCQNGGSKKKDPYYYKYKKYKMKCKLAKFR